MATVDVQQLRALVAAVHRPGERRTVVAVRSEPQWDGVEAIDGEPMVHVVACASPLAVRAALAYHATNNSDGSLLAVLTPCGEHELGPDVLARFVKGRVISADPFSALLALFRATTIDPVLVRERWLIDDLIALAPPGGWPHERPANGLVDVDRAWSVWQACRLPGVTTPSSIIDLIRLGDEPSAALAIGELPTAHRDRLASHWLGGLSPTPLLVERIAAGDGGRLVELGLVAEVLWAATDDPTLASLQSVGRARLEPLFGRDLVDIGAAGRWADAAYAVLADHPARVALADRADQLLAGADVADLAELSDQIPSGFELRLGRLATALARGDVDMAATALAAVEAHDVATRRRPRVEAAEAAVRLARRGAEPARVEPRNLAEAVTAYASDLAWVDEARALLAEGDPLPSLGRVYAARCGEIDDERRTFGRRFAELLAEWSRSEPVDDEHFVAVEAILERVAAPVAAVAPLLLLVCDGMGLPAAHQLLRDMAVEGWTIVTPASAAEWPVGITMLPTVTEDSRTSLLAGRRIEGGQPEERAGFESHPILRQRSTAARPPVLFHKAQLVGPDGRALPESVRAAVADPEQRVVGVVVNAVDDHLNRGHQVRVAWDLESMRPLAWLLDAAAEAGRVVVLTADHGHVSHVDGAVLRPPNQSGGERWRPTDTSTPVGADELEFVGPRVLKGGRVVLPTDERLRYGGNKHGYHGGATPQEVVVPVAVLARSLPAGWEYRPVATPEWWTGVPRMPTIAPVPVPEPVRAPRASGDHPTLFEPSPPAPATESGPVHSSWIDNLLVAASFAAHRTQVRLPRPIDDDRLTRYLDAIVANGGSIPLPALAERTGEPADQLRMALTLVQRLLNLDGAAILTIGADQLVVLDISLLALQFGIEIA